MGTFDTSLKGNDAFLDIYENFFRLYNEGQEPADISIQIQRDFADSFTDYEDKYNSFFGLALAQWETKSLDPNIFRQVKEIIASGQDLALWKELEGSEKDLKKRKAVLDKFLIRISNEREKPKRRVRQKFEFTSINLLKLPSPNGRIEFEIIECYTNGKYENTLSGLSFGSNGCSIFYFYEKGKYVTARWLDNKTLEISHAKDIVFTKNENYSRNVKIIYKPVDT